MSRLFKPTNMQIQWFRPIPYETRLGLVGKYTHHISVHVIGAISRRGASRLCVFEGKLDANGFVALNNEYLIPFIRANFPTYHRLQMDNAPSHMNGTVDNYFLENRINYIRTPAQSPDLNPINWFGMI